MTERLHHFPLMVSILHTLRWTMVSVSWKRCDEQIYFCIVVYYK